MSILQKKTKRAFQIWRKEGFHGLKQSFSRNYHSFTEKLKYQKWIREYDTLSDIDRKKIRQKIKSFSFKPLISVVLPVYNVEEKWLRSCIESVVNQIYENWELCIADDCSTKPHIRHILEEYAARDKRIKVIFRKENGHISAASNSALELANGEFCALLDHDDLLAEHALFYVANEINNFPETDMIYSDEDLITESGRRFAPKLKPDWSQDFFYSLNLITHLSVYRTEVLRKIGGFRIRLEGSQDYDLAFRVIESISAKNIRHIPQILYHWRVIPGSVALSGDEKPYAHERARQAIREHFERIGKKAKVTETFFNLHRVTYELPARLPKVSLIICEGEDFEATSQILKTLIEKTEYSNFEIILICSEKAKSANTLLSEKLKSFVSDSINAAEKFNFGAQKAEGEILIIIEADTEPLEQNWLKEVGSFICQPEIGAVGVKILNTDNIIRNTGVFLGIRGFLGFAHQRFLGGESGNFGRAFLNNNFSAVSGILAIRREVFNQMGGFDESNFGSGLFEIDFCLRLWEKDLRVVYTPYAEFIQYSDSPTEKVLKMKDSPEKNSFRKKWAHLIENDPFYNPNLSLKNEWFELAFPPRIKKPWKN